MRKIIAGSALMPEGTFYRIFRLSEDGTIVDILKESMTSDTVFPPDTDDQAKIIFVNKILTELFDSELTAEEITYLIKPTRNEMGEPV